MTRTALTLVQSPAAAAHDIGSLIARLNPDGKGIQSYGSAYDIDETLTEAQCLAVVGALNADTQPAGVEYATRTARSIVRVYPKADAHDPKAYLTAIALVMSEYPRGVLDRLADPRIGIARRLKFLPRVAEIGDECDNEMRRRNNLRRHAAWVIRHRRGIDWNDRDRSFEISSLCGVSADRKTWATPLVVPRRDGDRLASPPGEGLS